jgi:hypothetical protein
LNYLDRLGLREREALWRSFHEEHIAAKPEGVSGE